LVEKREHGATRKKGMTVDWEGKNPFSLGEHTAIKKDVSIERWGVNDHSPCKLEENKGKNKTTIYRKGGEIDQ